MQLQDEDIFPSKYEDQLPVEVQFTQEFISIVMNSWFTPHVAVQVWERVTKIIAKAGTIVISNFANIGMQHVFLFAIRFEKS